MKKKLLLSLLFIWSIVFSGQHLSAQTNPDIAISVTADKPDWVYNLSEKPRFKIVATQNGKRIKNVKVKYEWGPEKMPAIKSDSLVLPNGEAVVDAGSLAEPGFLRITFTTEGFIWDVSGQ